MRFIPIMLMTCASLVTSAAAHDHWINNNRYTNPVTDEWCCNSTDCQPIDASSIVRKPDGYHLPGGLVVPYKEMLTSEDDQFWVCSYAYQPKDRTAPRCLFVPKTGM